MPRRRLSPLFPIAVSPAELADQLGVRLEVISAAIKNGSLECFKHGLARRVLVEDAVEFVRKNWERV